MSPNRRDIGMVFQSYALWPHMTVFGNVAYPLRVRGRDRRDRERAVMEILAMVGMDRYAQRPVTELSGGRSLDLNVALVINNARIAAQVARAFGSRV